MDPFKLIGIGMFILSYTTVIVLSENNDTLGDFCKDTVIGIIMGSIGAIVIGFLMIIYKGLQGYGIYLP